MLVGLEGEINVEYENFKQFNFLLNSRGSKPASARRLVTGLDLNAPKLRRHAELMIGSNFCKRVGLLNYKLLNHNQFLAE